MCFRIGGFRSAKETLLLLSKRRHSTASGNDRGTINRESVANVQPLALFPGKPITDAADGFDEVGGVSEFFAEGADVDIDRAFKRICVLTT